MSEPKAVITYDDFVKLDLRVGTVEQAVVHPKGDKLLVLTVDFGLLGKRTICAGIRKFLSKTDLELFVGRQYVFCVNLAPRTMMGIESQGMILAASDDAHSKLALVKVGNPFSIEGEQLSEPLTSGSTVG